MIYFKKIFGVVVLGLFLSACTSTQSEDKASPVTYKIALPPKISQSTSTEFIPYEIATSSTGASNSAENKCLINKGLVKKITRSNGNTYTVCDFGDNKQCELWSLFRNQCPVGGVSITNYQTEAEIFCLVNGGKLELEQELCIVEGNSCSLSDYDEGLCF